ncbi:2-oxo acid dehydrogenase subunit E2 [Roseibium sp. M-1]
MEPAASPSVRALAQRKGIDLEKLANDLGRTTITADDLLGVAKAGSQPIDLSYWKVDHSRFGPVREEPVSRFAQVAADNLSAANSKIPAVTHHDRADITEIENFRKSLRSEAEARNVKLTSLAFQVKSVAHALQRFPKFNTSLSADGKTLFWKEYVHVGIAVDTLNGLMVPVVRDADKKGIWQIASEIADLAGRSQDRKIRPEEMSGASISITNLGGIGGQAFTPIVNPPEVAILGITKAEMTPVWNGSEFIPTQVLPLHLSYDHRVINGADAARFMTHLVGLLADPRKMLI